MQAFIKDNRMIINSMILDDDREKLLDFISYIEDKDVKAIPLYNIKGDISGLAFEAEENNIQDAEIIEEGGVK